MPRTFNCIVCGNPYPIKDASVSDVAKCKYCNPDMHCSKCKADLMTEDIKIDWFEYPDYYKWNPKHREFMKTNEFQEHDYNLRCGKCNKLLKEEQRSFFDDNNSWDDYDYTQ